MFYPPPPPQFPEERKKINLCLASPSLYLAGVEWKLLIFSHLNTYTLKQQKVSIPLKFLDCISFHQWHYFKWIRGAGINYREIIAKNKHLIWSLSGSLLWTSSAGSPCWLQTLFNMHSRRKLSGPCFLCLMITLVSKDSWSTMGPWYSKLWCLNE